MPDIGKIQRIDQTPIHILSAQIAHVDFPNTVYDGAVEVVPSEVAQILSTSGKTVTRDIVVQPIPNDYGRMDNYEDLYNKPKINDIELIGNKTGAQLKLQHQMREVSASEIDDIIFGGM